MTQAERDKEFRQLLAFIHSQGDEIERLQRHLTMMMRLYRAAVTLLRVRGRSV